DYVSFSQLSTYRGCPLRHHFRYVLGLPEPAVSASLVFGRAIHQAVEHHFNELLAGNESPSLDALLAEYDRAWSDADVSTVQFAKDDDVERLGQLAQRMLAAFQASAVAKPSGCVIGVEEELRGPIVPDCPDLLGRLDLLIESDDAVTILDLKTSRSRWSAEQVDDQAEQLLLYSELVRRIVPGKALRLQFAVITKTKEPSIELHEVGYSAARVERTRQMLRHVWAAIESGIVYPAPSLMGCSSCPFREPCRVWPG
ncbi:MAG: PD-(D/E)XK nuclease family protein, partial [Planctomycetaceae bacterium]|nr:PD-(D/E)XK nuclease family protein [Planctomycetaceae bacterium]